MISSGGIKMTIIQMKEALKQGSTTSEQLVTDSLAKIAENSGLNAVIEVNPDALDIARARDADPDKSGALHSIPILLKDNVNTGDKMATSAGSVSLAKNIAADDAPAAKLLREAGAVIVGKANMTEFANYMCDFRKDEKMPNGYSSRGGQALHPTHPDADPSGSSTGSGVAVAAGLVPAAVGSETYGSIISPSQACGIVGIKPTDGLVSKSGVIPISFTLDTLGPMAACVEDAALMLGAMCGKTYDMGRKPAEITVGICYAGMDNAKWMQGTGKAWRGANEGLAAKMKQIGMKVKDLPDDDIVQYANAKDDYFIFPLMRYEFQHAMNSYLAAQKNPDIPQNLCKIIEYNRLNSDVALKYGQGNLVAAAEIGEDWQARPEYIAALAERAAAQATLDAYFDRHGIDVLMMMSAHCGLAAATGFPSITFPLGLAENGRPAGCLLMARRFGEDILLAAARHLEAD
jgi:amidase